MSYRWFRGGLLLQSCVQLLCLLAASLPTAAALNWQQVTQQAYLKSFNPDRGDHIGSAVAASGDLVAVASVTEGSGATGINGDPTDNSAPLSGAVYVFSRQNGTWVQEAYLKASNAGIADQFGHAIAMSGNTLVVTAPFESSYPQAKPDPVNNDLFLNAGAAYVFVRNGGTWTQEAILKAGDAYPGDNFGNAVAIDGDTIVVGARFENSNASGINPSNADDHTSSAAGAAYVFTRSAGKWSQVAMIKSPVTRGQIEFGWSVAVAEKNIFVGTIRDTSPATGINGDYSLTSTNMTGAVFAYRLTPNGLVYDAFIKASNPDNGDGFGFSIAASGQTLVVGALNESGGSTNINGDQGNSTTKKSSGAVYVFERSAQGWAQTTYIKAPVTAANDRFGLPVALDGDSLAVGSDTIQPAAGASNRYKGGAYLYSRQNGTWGFKSLIKRQQTNLDESYAASLALAGNTLVVGAPDDDNGGIGVNNPATTFRDGSGAAYIYTAAGSALPPLVFIQLVKLQSNKLVVEFSSDPAMNQWKILGGSSLPTQNQDLTSVSTVSETTPGNYRAEIPLGLSPLATFFVKIQP